VTSKEKKTGMLRVKPIQNGIVIDHIPAGKSTHVLSILNIGEDFSETVTIAMNVPSKKNKKKDIVKVENKDLSEDEFNQLAVIAPSATINKIKDSEVVEKKQVVLPKKIIGSIKCGNPDCITNKEREPVTSVFLVKNTKPLVLTCKYCERKLA